MVNGAGEGETPTSFPGSLSYPSLRVGKNAGNEVGGDSSTKVACVASVSKRVIGRKLERKQKKGWAKVRAEAKKRLRRGNFLRSPPPPPSFMFFFALVPAF